jgi:hypothetical protein
MGIQSASGLHLGLISDAFLAETLMRTRRFYTRSNVPRENYLIRCRQFGRI